MISRRAFLRSGRPGRSGRQPRASPRDAAVRPARQAATPRFDEVPSSASGITWVHDNAHVAGAIPARIARSRLRVSRLRQRRVDGHLPGQQRAVATSSSPPGRSRTRSTRTTATAPSPTSPTRPAWRAARSAWAWPSATTTTTAFRIMFVTGVRPLDSLSQQRRRDVHRRDGEGRPRAGACRLDDERRLVRLRQRRPARSLRLQLRPVPTEPGPGCARRRTRTASLYYHYCIPHLFKPTPSVLFHNNGDGTFTPGQRHDGHRAHARQGPRRRRHRHQQRRPDRSVRRQRHGAELPVPEPRPERAGGKTASPPASRSARSGNLRSGMGVDAADLNGDGWQDLFVANIDHEMFSLYENHNGAFFTDVAPDHGLAQATRLLSGWGVKFFDFDNDGLVDLLARQRPSGRHDRAAGARRPLQGTAAALPARRPPAAQRQPAGRAGVREDVLGARPGRRRLRQRRPRRRPRRLQRRRARAAAQHARAGQPLGRA